MAPARPDVAIVLFRYGFSFQPFSLAGYTGRRGAFVRQRGLLEETLATFFVSLSLIMRKSASRSRNSCRRAGSQKGGGTRRAQQASLSFGASHLTLIQTSSDSQRQLELSSLVLTCSLLLFSLSHFFPSDFPRRNHSLRDSIRTPPERRLGSEKR